jgi:hypothetical protein
MRTPIVHVVRRSDLLHLPAYQMVIKTACIRGDRDRMYAKFDGRLRSRPASPILNARIDFSSHALPEPLAGWFRLGSSPG